MTHFAGAKFTVHFRCDVDLERGGDYLGHFANGHAVAAADVHRQSVEFVGFGGEQVGPGDVFNKRHVTGLVAVFVKDGWQIIQQSGAENRNHAGVGIEDRLARAIGAGVAQRYGGDPGLFSPEQDEPFLIHLCQARNRLTAHRSVFGRWYALGDRAADWAMDLPVTAAQLVDRSDGWKNHSVLRTFRRAFAVNRLRAGDDNLFDRQIFFPNYFQHLSGAERVHVHELRHLRHVTAIRRLMEENVNLVERGPDGVAVAQIAAPEFGVFVQPGRLTMAMRLRLELVQSPDGPPFSHEEIDQVRSDQAGTTGNESSP